MTSLLLSDNRLTGEIPPELGDLLQLRELDLARNALRGEIPSALGNLRNLISMRLSGNRLTGKIPPELGNLADLMDLSLTHNALTGDIPSTLRNLSNLARLDLSHNALTGKIAYDLTSLGNLIVLDLSANDLTGPIPVDIVQMTDLWSLKLNSTLLSGTIPAGLGRLRKLEFLELAFNDRLTGAVPARLRELALDTLDLTGTPVCISADAGYQGWLRTVEHFRSPGLTCGEPVPAESIVDIAVVYTPAAVRGAGGTAQLEAIVDLMVAEANQAYEASGVKLQIALVVREEVPYVEVDTSTDLRRLLRRGDGYLDEVHDIRDRAGADLVHLVVGTDDYDAAGIADMVGAFGISHYRGGGITFAHELGHNMGLNHDRYPGCRTNRKRWPPFAYGYVNQQAFGPDAPSSAHWFTIMANHDECGAAGLVCAELPRFSSPDQSHAGDPLGVPGEEVSFDVGGPADAVRVLNTMRHSVASLRDRGSGNRPHRTTSSLSFEDGTPTETMPSRLPSPSTAVAGLFAALPSMLQEATAPGGFGALRRRAVTIDSARLESLPAAGGPLAPPTLVLNLFDDVTLTATVERRNRTFSGGYSLSGRLAGMELGTMMLVANGAVVAGTVRTPVDTYRILPAGQGRSVVIQLDPSRFARRGDFRAVFSLQSVAVRAADGGNMTKSAEALR